MPARTKHFSPHFAAAIGQRVRECRTRAELSLRELAKATGLSHVGLWELEMGQTVPGAAVLWRLSKAFRVSIDYLVAGGEPAWKVEGD